MLGRDHALSGAAAFTAAAPLLHVTGIIPLAAGAVLTAGAALLPDLDQTGSSAARSLGFATRAFAWLIRRLAGGHRHGTHSLLGLAAFTAVVTVIARWSRVHALAGGASSFTPGGYWFRDWLVPVLGWQTLPVYLVTVLLVASALRALRIGGHRGDLIAFGIAAALTWFQPVTVLWTLPAVTALGCAIHMAGDALTDEGIPVLWPFSHREFHLLPSWLRFTTGQFAEHWIVSPLLIAGLAAAAARDFNLI